MAGEIGALRVTLGANTANFEQGMRRAARTARSTGQEMERGFLRMSNTGLRAFSTLRVGAVALAGALAGSALFQYAKGAIEWASGLSETAQQIGVTVEQLQILRLAADQNGASVEGMERAVAILNRTLGQAKAGLPAAVQAFSRIGITQEQLQSFRSAGDIFPVVAQHISEFGTEAEQAAAAQALFGRGAAELLPILAQGRAGWDRATQAAIRNGLVTEEQARKADEAADSLSEMASAIRVQLLNAVLDALPGLTALIRGIGDLVSMLITAFGWIGQVASALGGLASAMNAVGGGRGGGTAGAALDLAARGGRGFLLDRLLPNQGVFGGILGTVMGATSSAQPRHLSMATPGGGGRGGGSDQLARRQHQYEIELLQLQAERLRAEEDGTQAIDERNRLQGLIADIEAQIWLKNLEFRVQQGEITAVEGDRLNEIHNQLIAAEAQTRALQYNARVAEQESERARQQEGYAQDRLQAEADMAVTMAERRRLELDLLRITTENRRRALQDQIARANAGNDPQAAALAQLELDNLGSVQSRERRRIMRDTRGPIESYLANIPATAAQVNESLQSIATEGLKSIEDALVGVIMGTQSMGKAFKQVAASIIADLLRIQIQRAILGPLANALGGLIPGGGGGASGFGSALTSFMGGIGARAAGGPVLPGRTYLIGEKGPELLHMGGMAGHVIANDEIGGGGGVTIHQSYSFSGVAVTKDEFVQGLMAAKDATLRDIRNQNRRRA